MSLLSSNDPARSGRAKLYERPAAELTNFAAFVMDPAGVAVSWSAGVEGVFGYTEAEWLGQAADRIFTVEDRAEGKPEEERQRARREGQSRETRWYETKRGERLCVESAVVALCDGAGQLLGFSKVMRDITKRYWAEKRSAFESRLDEVLRPLKDPDEMMSAAVRLLGEYLEADRCTYSEVEADEETFEILCDFDRPGVGSMRGRYRLTDFGTGMAESMRAGRPSIVESVERDPSLEGSREAYLGASVRAHATVPLHKAGKLVAIMAVQQRSVREWRPDEVELVRLVGYRCWESLERSQVGRALRESEARYRTLFDSIDEGYCMIEVLFDAAGNPYDYRYLELNPAFEHNTGLRKATGRTARELVPNHEQYWIETYGRVATTGEPTRFVNRAEGLSRWFDVYAFRVGAPERRQVAVLFRDITAQRTAETEREILLEQLDIERQRLEQVFTQAPVAVIVFRGREFVVELANSFYQTLVAGRELVGRPFAEVMPDLPPGIWKILHSVFETGEPYFATDWYIPYDFDGDGTAEDRWFNVGCNPRREADGTVSGLIAVLTEVTAQVQARQELERVNRSLEEFAYVASHDLQEPLRMVNIYTQLILKTVGAGDRDLNEYAAVVKQGVGRMEELIRDLLTFSRTIHTEEVPPGTADLGAALEDALLVLQTRIEESRATITASALPRVRGETKQLAHVFQNLIGNSLKYRRQDQAPEISIAATREGEQWVVAVRDNGIGFEPRYAKQIFGLFKRLYRDEYPGTGLGLAICHRLIERYGGRIWAESQEGVRARPFSSRWRQRRSRARASSLGRNS